MDEGATILCFLVGLIIVGVSGCTILHTNNLEEDKLRIKLGLQQCQIIGSKRIIWQRECLVPKGAIK